MIKYGSLPELFFVFNIPYVIFIPIVIRSAPYALLRVSPEYLQTNSIVTGYRAYSVHYIDSIMCEKGNGHVPWGRLDEVM